MQLQFSEALTGYSGRLWNLLVFLQHRCVLTLDPREAPCMVDYLELLWTSLDRSSEVR